MACCNKKIKVDPNQKEIVKIVKNGLAAKSNRSPAGTIAKECPVCKTKTITIICPVCHTKIS